MAERQRIPYLDVARYLAAAAVALYHYGHFLDDNPSVATKPAWIQPFAEYGDLGVQFFFILSGFVILPTALSNTGSSFVLKRIQRLAPMFLVAGLFTFLFRLYFPSAEGAASFKDLVGHVTFLSLTPLAPVLNIHLLDGPYWTLSFEVLFYIFIAVFLVTSNKDKIYSFLWFWLALSFALTFIHPHHTSAVEQFIRVMSMFELAPFFIAGCFFYYWNSQPRLTFQIAAGLLLCLLLSLFHSTGLILAVQNWGSNYPRAMIGTKLGCLLIVTFYLFFSVICLHRREKSPKAWIPERWQLTLGRISYPLYLIHCTVGLQLMVYLTPPFGGTSAAVITLVIMSLAAYLLSQYAEVPLQWLFYRNFISKRNASKLR